MASTCVVNAHDIARAAKSALSEASNIVIFDPSLGIIHTHECSPTAQELISLRDAFENREAALQRGLHLGGLRFEVYRHHPPLIYGRKMVDSDPETSPGIAVAKVDHSILQTPLYTAITYQMPNTSARMVAALSAFCSKHLQAPLQQ